MFKRVLCWNIRGVSTFWAWSLTWITYTQPCTDDFCMSHRFLRIIIHDMLLCRSTHIFPVQRTGLVCYLLKETKLWWDLNSKSFHLSSVSIHDFSTLWTLRPCMGQVKVTQEWVPASWRIRRICSIWKCGCGKNEEQQPANCFSTGITITT